jgi:hypothetical protein
MSRWLLALLFAFGTVTFLTGCPADDAAEEEAAPAEGDDAAPAEGDDAAPAEGDDAPAE